MALNTQWVDDSLTKKVGDESCFVEDPGGDEIDSISDHGAFRVGPTRCIAVSFVRWDSRLTEQ